MKKFVTMILCSVLIVSVLATSASAASGLQNFQKTVIYADQFADVQSGSWYYNSVASAYAYGLMNGLTNSQFSPTDNIQLSQAITMAARLHSIYYDDKTVFTNSSPWYTNYVQYAIDNGIITKGQFADYTAYATRAEFAQIFANAFPTEALDVKNIIADGAIPDVDADKAIYKLFRAGVMTGKTSTGLFYPNDNIQRNEAAAVVTRMADQTLRVSVTLTSQQGGDISSGSSATDLKNKVNSAKDAAATAITSFSAAKAYYQSVVSAGDPITIAVYTDAMYKTLQSTMTAAQACSTDAKISISLCEGNTKLDKVSADLEKVVLCCDEATKAIPTISQAPATGDWAIVEQYLNLCGSTITDALKDLG